MRSILIAVIALIIIVSLPSFAQQGKQSLDQKLGGILGHNINLQQVEGNIIHNQWRETYGNQSIITQVGNQNIADVNQTTANSSGIGNKASIIQYFHNNDAEINQTGNKNTSNISQTGFDNQATTNVSGNNNNTLVLQLGNRNQATQEITGNSKTFYLIQAGNDNTFYQSSINENVKGYKVYQMGSGMNLKIMNGRY